MTDERIFELARQYVHYDMSVDTLAFARAIIAECQSSNAEPVAYLSTEPRNWTSCRIKKQGTFTVPVYAHPAPSSAKTLDEAWEQYNKDCQWGHEPTARAIFEDGWNAAK